MWIRRGVGVPSFSFPLRWEIGSLLQNPNPPRQWCWCVRDWVVRLTRRPTTRATAAPPRDKHTTPTRSPLRRERRSPARRHGRGQAPPPTSCSRSRAPHPALGLPVCRRLQHGWRRYEDEAMGEHGRRNREMELGPHVACWALGSGPLGPKSPGDQRGAVQASTSSEYRIV